MSSRLSGLTFLLVASALLVGCAPEMESRAAADYAGTPRNMFIIAVPGPPYLLGEWPGFRAGILDALHACGIIAEMSRDATHGMAADLRTRLRSGDLAGKFDTVLQLQLVGQHAMQLTKDGYAIGLPSTDSLHYEALVEDAASGRAVFRAQFWMTLSSPLNKPGSRGAEASRALVRRMARDHILRSCPQSMAAAVITSAGT